ncbi:hypothetical protein [Streptomyces profundus]|uniref:hypothetical protein n=1 Tax=Streptomyces profundus TaxID=2867410 RepID=UPI001D16A7B6|nr:hypothetical protein [Streptomyces sp. MA3_2.13]UED84531.1 hypothetical protein K4G22_10205 [Streptomyces sp. MA3_2.13]
MARLKHTVILAPVVSRSELTRVVSVPHDVWASLHAEGHQLFADDGRLVRGIALLAGEHARPGARYDRDEATAAPLAEGEVVPRVTLLAWDPGAETALRVDGQRLGPGPSPRLAAEFRLRDVSHPKRATLRIDGSMSRPGRQRRRWLRWFTLKADLDVARWYASAAGESGPPPLRVQVVHSLVRAEARAVPRPADGGWAVDLLITARGRGILRPVVAVPLQVAKRILRRSLDRNLPRAAEAWRTEIQPELTRDPAELRRQMLDELCMTEDERAAPGGDAPGGRES